MKATINTVVRTAIFYICLVAEIITQVGVENTVTKAIVTGATIIASVWAWWKNNSFTEAAISADAVMDFLKENKDVALVNITTDEEE